MSTSTSRISIPDTSVFVWIAERRGFLPSAAAASDYKAIGASLTIDPVITTTRMAGPEELMSQEKAYLGALPKTTRFDIRGDRLELWGKTGRVASFRLTKP